jgi:hypothetical protein
MNCSAAASTRGWRAVDPTAVMEPERLAAEVAEELVEVVEPLVPEADEQAARPRPAIVATPASEKNWRRDMDWFIAFPSV